MTTLLSWWFCVHPKTGVRMYCKAVSAAGAAFDMGVTKDLVSRVLNETLAAELDRAAGYGSAQPPSQGDSPQ